MVSGKVDDSYVDGISRHRPLTPPVGQDVSSRRLNWTKPRASSGLFIYASAIVLNFVEHAHTGPQEDGLSREDNIGGGTLL